MNEHGQPGRLRRSRILCVGPNKTGTTALSRFFEANGIRSITMGGPYRANNLAHRMLRNITAERPILHGLEHFEAFSDFNWMEKRYCLNEAVFLSRLVEEHPDAYFIYNTRDLDSWIESRRKHHGGRYLRNYMDCFHVDEPTALAMWRTYHEEYRERVLRTVGGVSGKLLEFNISTDKPERLVEFLKPDYEIDAAHWRHVGASSIDTPMKRIRRLIARFAWSEPKVLRRLRGG